MDRHQSFDYLVFEDDVPPQPAPSTRKSWWAGIVTAVLLIGSSVAYTSARDAPYFWVPWGDRDTPKSPSAERRPIILTTVASTESLLAQQNAVLGNKVILTFPAPIKDGTVAEGLLTIADWAQQNPPTTVVVESQGIKCSQTTFAFSTSVLSQKIYCRTVSGSTNAAQNGQIVDVPVTFSYPYSPVCQAESQFVQREMQTSGRCSAWGDPHLTTFDGVAYDFQPDGVFRYFSTRNFEIQVFQEKCPPSRTGQANAPSCYQAIAITYADSVLRLYIKDNKVSLMRGSESLRWFQVYKYGGNTEGYRVFLLTDVTSYVDVTVGTWVENYGYLNIVANLSPFFKDPSIQGLMGNWNGIPGDDSKDVTALAKANRYPMDDNLFVCTTTCSKWTTIPTAVDNAALQIYVELANLRQGFTAVDLKTIDWTTYTPTFRTLPPKAVMLQATTDVTARATDLCNKVISGVPLCETYVPNKSFFINNVCIADSVFMGDLGIVDNTKIAYLRECRRELEARLIGAIGDVKALAKLNADRDTLQFGELTLCPSNCNGHGQCLPAACQCDSGYTGYACTIVI